MDCSRNTLVMENSVQQKIKDLSDEVKKLARDILKEKALKDLRCVKEKYSESKPGLIYDGEINNVYSRLCAIRDEWNSLYYQDTIDRRKGQFKIACACFEKERLKLRTFLIGGPQRLITLRPTNRLPSKNA